MACPGELTGGGREEGRGPDQASGSFILLYPQCSFGFIYEREQLEATCPQCHQTFCVRCKRQVRPIHPFRVTCQTRGMLKHGTDVSSGVKELTVVRKGGREGGRVKGKVRRKSGEGRQERQ